MAAGHSNPVDVAAQDVDRGFIHFQQSDYGQAVTCFARTILSGYAVAAHAIRVRSCSTHKTVLEVKRGLTVQGAGKVDPTGRDGRNCSSAPP